MYLDLLLVSLIVLLALFGFIQGFIKQLISLIMWVTILAFAFPVGQWLKLRSGWTWFSEAPDLVAWGVASMMIGLGFLILQTIVHLAKKNPHPTRADRWLGLGLGATKGFIMTSVICLSFHLIPEDIRTKFDQFDRDIKRSTMMKISQPMLSWDVVSAFKSLDSLRERLNQKIDRFEKKTERFNFDEEDVLSSAP